MTWLGLGALASGYGKNINLIIYSFKNKIKKKFLINFQCFNDSSVDF